MKTDDYRLERISEIGHQLLEVIDRRGISEDDVVADLEIPWMISTPLFNIGEQANCLSAEFTAMHDEVPWTSIAGLRHRLVHDYEGTNWRMVAHVLFHELQPLVAQVDGLLMKDDV